jgi:hypothetical protein
VVVAARQVRQQRVDHVPVFVAHRATFLCFVVPKEG